MAESIYPFLPDNAVSPSGNFPFDIVIGATAFPGIQFLPTEPNGEYQEIREVSGNLWLVTNAMWNQNLLQWDQESPQNTGLPAYALELGADGSMTRWESPPTNIPSTPITWTRLFQIDNKGQVISVPLTVLTINQASQQIFVTWDPGVGVQVQGRLLQVTDVASAANSLLDNLVVNGVSKWAVDKTGTLVTGIIPSARITGLGPFPGFNNVTLTGATVVAGTLDVFGAGTFHSSLTADTTLFVVGLTTTGSLHVTGGATVDASLTANSTLDVLGHTQLANVTLNPGTHIDVNGTTPVVTLSSPDGSITISQPTSHSYTVQAPTTANHISIGGAVVSYGGSPLSLTVPSNGASWNVVCQAFIQYTSSGGVSTLNVTGTGGTAGGAWQGGSDPVANLPATTFGQFTLQLNGLANPGDTVTCTVSSSGAVSVSTSNIQITAFRVT